MPARHSGAARAPEAINVRDDCRETNDVSVKSRVVAPDPALPSPMSSTDSGICGSTSVLAFMSGSFCKRRMGNFDGKPRKSSHRRRSYARKLTCRQFQADICLEDSLQHGGCKQSREVPSRTDMQSASECLTLALRSAKIVVV